MKVDVEKYWPHKNFKIRDSQKLVLDWMGEQPSDIKHYICEMPVGTGKSLIGYTFSEWKGGNSAFFTPQKILQKQYEETFKGKIFSLYGKGNYICKSKATSCDIGSIIKPPCGGCPAKAAMSTAIESKHIVVNYSLGFLLSMIPNMIKRNSFIFDECHTIEKVLTDLNTLSISEFKCNHLKIPFQKFSSDFDILNWVSSSYKEGVNNQLNILESQVEEIGDTMWNNKSLTKDNLSILKRYHELVEHSKKIDNIITSDKQDIFNKYALVKEDKLYKFKELFGKDVFKRFIEPNANNFLHMSATILNKDQYCSDLGIDPSKVAFISIPSEFPVKNRTTFYAPAIKMTYGWDKEKNEQARNDALNTIIDLCNEHHKNENGIIHTGSFAVSRWLIQDLQNMIPHRIMHHSPDAEGNAENRDLVIDEFIQPSDEPKLLISPSITEGLDLCGDRARFSIIMKVPFPNISDAWVKRRMNISNEWYKRQALMHIIQGTGRIIRSKEDWGINYILDESFISLYRSMYEFIPTWWKEALVM
jgi:Rad3-related DNA helicase